MTAPPAEGLPHDHLAEKALLGCLLVDSSSFDEVSDLRLDKDDFHHRRHGIIYEVVADLVAANAPVDYVSVHSKLNERGLLASVGGQSFLTEINEDQASAANVRHYAAVVKDKSSLRSIIRKAHQVAELGKTFSGDLGDFLQEVESAFFNLTNDARAGRMERLSGLLKQNMKEIEDVNRGLGDIQGLATGYDRIDHLLLGMQPGQLIILAARPAMGKTSLALNIAQRTCAQTNLPVAVFSLEMMGSELSMRMLTCQSKVDSRKIRSKDLRDDDLRRIGDAVETLSALPLYINDAGGSTALGVQSQCRKLKAEQGLGLVVVDYIQLMGVSDSSLPREQQISEISRGLKTMAKELECPVIALSQLNRSVESRPNKRPTLSDLRESGAIEQDADIVVFVYRDVMYNPDTPEPNVAEVIVAKNRSGETGLAKLSWVGSYTSFENLSPQQGAPGGRFQDGADLGV